MERSYTKGMWSRKPSAALLGVVLACICWVDARAGQLPDLNHSWISPAIHVRSDGRIYVLERAYPPDAYVVELYDLKTGSVDLTQRPPVSSTGRSGGTSQVLFGGDRLLVCSYDQCQVYDPSRNAWTAMTIPGGDTELVLLLDGGILRAGGFGYFLQTAESYVIDPSTLVATATQSMNEGRDGQAMVRLADGRVLTAGGLHWFLLGAVSATSAEIFDPATRLWTKVAQPKQWLWGCRGWLLPDGRVLIWTGGEVEIYDPVNDSWRQTPHALAERGSGITYLPNGTLLFSGGTDAANRVLNTTQIYDPISGITRSARPLKILRSYHGAAVLPDGGVLALAGYTAPAGQPSFGVLTNSVEQIYWGESRLTATLDPGFYVVSTTQDQYSTDGLWSVEVQSPGGFEGGWNFGGLLPAAGRDVGFASFSLAAPATVSAQVNLQALPGTTGPLEFTLQLLDANRKVVAGPVSGLGNLQWSQALQPGYYIVELLSSNRAPAAAFQMSLLAPHLAAGASGGAVLEKAAGVAGFVGFYVGSRQDVQIKVYNENTFGRSRGVGEVTLTLYDASGRILQAAGPQAP